MAFASGGPGAHPGGTPPGVGVAGTANQAGPSWANLLNVAGQALQQIGLPQGTLGGGGTNQGMLPPQLSYMMQQSPYNMARPY